MALWPPPVTLRGSSVPPESMPSSDSRTAIHWSYPSAWAPAPTPAPPTLRHTFKRSRSVTDDCEDDYSEESSKEQYVIQNLFFQHLKAVKKIWKENFFRKVADIKKFFSEDRESCCKKNYGRKTKSPDGDFFCLVFIFCFSG